MADIKSVLKKANTIKEARKEDKKKEDKEDTPKSAKKLFWKK
jgi:hypothetical protein